MIEKTESGYRGIYVHSDGYLDGVGKTLLTEYMDQTKVSSLIDLGDCNSLGKYVEPFGPWSHLPHSFNNPQEDVTVAYGRDRGETEIEPKIGNTVEEVSNQIGHNGYVYVFENSAWTCNGKDFSDFKEDGEKEED